jgi:hypothetical protein
MYRKWGVEKDVEDYMEDYRDLGSTQYKFYI